MLQLLSATPYQEVTNMIMDRGRHCTSILTDKTETAKLRLKWTLTSLCPPLPLNLELHPHTTASMSKWQSSTCLKRNILAASRYIHWIKYDGRKKKGPCVLAITVKKKLQNISNKVYGITDYSPFESKTRGTLSEGLMWPLQLLPHQRRWNKYEIMLSNSF